MSSQLDRIIGGQPGEASILSDVVALLREKNKDYGDNAVALGVKGQFSDIWRKIGKLRTALWDGKELQGEQPEEILMDLIGHCLLTIDLIREGGKESGERTQLTAEERRALRTWLLSRHAEDLLRGQGPNSPTLESAVEKIRGGL